MAHLAGWLRNFSHLLGKTGKPSSTQGSFMHILIYAASAQLLGGFPWSCEMGWFSIGMDHSPIPYQAPINSPAFRKISSKASGKGLIFGASNDGFVSHPWSHGIGGRLKEGEGRGKEQYKPIFTEIIIIYWEFI